MAKHKLVTAERAVGVDLDQLSGHSSQLPKIDYSQTRKVSLDAAHLTRHRVLNNSSNPRVLAAYKLLRTQILQKLSNNGWNSVGVVSARRNEGKTLTAINLSMSIARDYNHTALLVDFDLSDPSIGTFIGLEAKQGVDDYLAGRCDLAAALINPEHERFVVLPARKAVMDASEILASPATRALVAELRARYADRVIVFDLPPILEMDEALAFSPYVDAILIVVEERRTTKEDMQRLEHILQHKPVLGTVLNKSVT